MKKIEKILVPVDFSDGSTVAARYALSLARSLGAELHFLHIYGVPVISAPDGGFMMPPEMVARVASDAQDGLKEFVESLPLDGVEWKRVVADGAAHQEIVRRAGEGGYDIIVMGTHGRTGLKHFLIGSTAERVVRLSPVPVLTVPLGDD